MADPPKEYSTFERMNGRSELLPPNKITHYFKEWTTGSRFFIKIYLYKNLMLQTHPLNRSFSQKLLYPRNKIKAKLSTPHEQFFGESTFSENYPSSANVYNCPSKNFAMLNC